MKAIIEQYGVTIISVIIGIVIFIGLSALLLFYQRSNVLNSTQKQREINEIRLESKPLLVMKSLIWPKGKPLELMQGVYADDGEGNDITDKVKVYGAELIDINVEGLYWIDYYVENGKGLMDTVNRLIVIEDINNLGDIHVESLSDGMTVSESLNVYGWAVSTDTQAIVQISIDDNIVVEAAERHENEDIAHLLESNHFPYITVDTNPLPGYSSSIDVSTYSDNRVHLLTLSLMSGKGDEIMSREFTFKVEN